MTSRIPEPASDYEAEGVPDMGYTLDEKEITGDAQEGLAPPRDYPTAVDDWGTTAAEESAGEPLDLRLSREEPDVLDAADRPADSEASDADADTPFDGQGAGLAGRLVEPDEGGRTDDEATTIAADLGTDGGGFSAEESAMHVEREV